MVMLKGKSPEFDNYKQIFDSVKWDVQNYSESSNINKARLNNSDVPFYEYMFYRCFIIHLQWRGIYFNVGEYYVLTALRLLAFVRHDRKT